MIPASTESTARGSASAKMAAFAHQSTVPANAEKAGKESCARSAAALIGSTERDARKCVTATKPTRIGELPCYSVLLSHCSLTIPARPCPALSEWFAKWSLYSR